MFAPSLFLVFAVIFTWPWPHGTETSYSEDDEDDDSGSTGICHGTVCKVDLQ